MRHSGNFSEYLALVERCKVAESVFLRHDGCSCTLQRMLEFARAEAAAGLHGTYFFLHGTPEWNTPAMREAVAEIIALGHTVGLHHASIAQFLRTTKEPREILLRALDELRKLADVTMIAAHGSPQMYDVSGRLQFVEYEAFVECDPTKNVTGALTLPFQRASTREMGVVEVYLDGMFSRYASDSAGAWRGWRGPPLPKPFERLGGGMVEGLSALDDIGAEDRIMILSHPCYWAVGAVR